MREGQVVTVVRVGAGGMTVIAPDGGTKHYGVKGTIVNVPVGSNLSGDYRVLLKRAQQRRETKA